MAHNSKEKKGGMNKKVLRSLEATAPEPFRPKTMIHLRGGDAKRFVNLKPGTKISAQIKGMVQSVGMNEFENNMPTAELRITSIKPSRKGK